MAFHSNLDVTDQSIELVGARTVELVYGTRPLRNHAAVETQHIVNLYTHKMGTNGKT